MVTLISSLLFDPRVLHVAEAAQEHFRVRLVAKARQYQAEQPVSFVNHYAPHPAAAAGHGCNTPSWNPPIHNANINLKFSLVKRIFSCESVAGEQLHNDNDATNTVRLTPSKGRGGPYEC